MREYDPYGESSMPPTNGLGTAGFVVSLIGFIACQPISPIGLVMSLAAMRKEPRGLAIAGVVLGLLGSLVILAVVAVFLVIGAAGIIAAVLGAGYGEIIVDGNRIVQASRDWSRDNGAAPTSLDQLSLTAEDITDHWGNPYRLHVVTSDAHLVRIYSDGPDNLPNTDDDILFEKSGVSWNIDGGTDARSGPAPSAPADQSQDEQDTEREESAGEAESAG